MPAIGWKKGSSYVDRYWLVGNGGKDGPLQYSSIYGNYTVSMEVPWKLSAYGATTANK